MSVPCISYISHISLFTPAKLPDFLPILIPIRPSGLALWMILSFIVKNIWRYFLDDSLSSSFQLTSLFHFLSGWTLYGSTSFYSLFCLMLIQSHHCQVFLYFLYPLHISLGLPTGVLPFSPNPSKTSSTKSSSALLTSPTYQSFPSEHSFQVLYSIC